MPRERSALSTGERRRALLAAARRPLHLLVLAAGLGIFATTLALWVLPLTLATYAALTFFSFRDESFRSRVLEDGAARALPDPGSDISPDRRARWLPRGQTRERVEAALDVQRRTVDAVEQAGDVTREVLSGAVPKLHGLAESMVDLAHRREKASAEARSLESRAQEDENLRSHIRGLEEEVARADEELDGMVGRLLALRAKAVRVSLESQDPARDAAGGLMRDLDDLNRRLDALRETLE